MIDPLITLTPGRPVRYDDALRLLADHERLRRTAEQRQILAGMRVEAKVARLLGGREAPRGLAERLRQVRSRA